MNVNWPIFAIAVLWGLLETAYFGWNWAPKSNAELIADGFTALLYALSFVVPR